MAPILIDNRGLIKLGLISVLTTVIVFAAGFLGGYQRATNFYTAGSKIEILPLPVQDAFLESAIQPQSPDTLVAGEEIDVDQPQVELNTDPKVNSIANTIDVSNDSAVNSAVREKVSTSVDNKKVTSNNNQNQSAKAATTKEPESEVITTLLPVELNNIKYSIQVGLYGRLVNAENMMRMLQAQDLDAYVSDYINKKNESRYNVRFGYFVDKKSALTALKQYKNKQKGDGYLVNFSVENITNLADAENIRQSIISEKTKKNASPETVPSEAMSTQAGQDKISHAEVITASNVLAKAQDEGLVDIHTRKNH